jgi:hypothetical protein
MNQSPIKSVHQFCIECNGSGIAANNCTNQKCTIHAHRKGTVKKGTRTIPVLTAIKTYCQQCTGGERVEVEKCTGNDCPFYHFRLGRNPYRKRKVLTEKQLNALSRGRKTPKQVPATG